MKKIYWKKIKNILLILPISLVFPLVACSSNKLKDNPSLYDMEDVEKSQYNYRGKITDDISTDELLKFTVSIGFEFLNNVQKEIRVQNGTAWIFKQGKNEDFYLATNLHVANILSFDDDQQLENDLFNKIQSSSITFVPSKIYSKSPNKKNYFSGNELRKIYVEKPSIVYTTTTDKDYNSLFSDKVYGTIKTFDSSTSKYKEESSELLQGVTDIAILKYYLPYKETSKPKEYYKNISSKNENDSHINDFIGWLHDAKNLNIKILDKNFDDYIKELKISKYDIEFYMGGFPKDSKNSNELSWRGFSSFKLNPLITSNYENSFDIYKKWTKGTNPEPIKYWDKKTSNQKQFNTYNYVSAGKEGFFYSFSDKGASGSPIIAKLNNKLYVVGIYWGVANFSINGVERKLGSADFFSSNSHNKKFNLITNINQKISKN